jgi:hypothetical protein
MKQNSPFWEWAVRVRGWNALLRNTTHHLDDGQLRNQLEANVENGLAIAIVEEDITEQELDKWLSIVKNLDNKKRRDRQQQRADAEEAVRAHLKRNRTSAGLSEPSCRYNRAPNATPSSSTPITTRLPKMTENERRLLLENEGCLKCRRFFAGHHSNTCPNGFQSAQNYRTLMAEDVNNAHRRNNNGTVVSVTPVQVMDTTSFPIAAVMPLPNKSCILDMSGSDLSKESDNKLSPNETDLRVPYSMPHYVWGCATTCPRSGKTAKFSALLDPGSHMILINSSVVDRLNLRRRKLPKPAKVGLATTLANDLESCSDTVLHEWVKLKPHDVDGHWMSRTVRTIVAPNLCTDVLLGIPFFTVNKLVMDFEIGTCIEKETGFDLLHPRSLATMPMEKMPLQKKHKELRRCVRECHSAVIEELQRGVGLDLHIPTKKHQTTSTHHHQSTHHPSKRLHQIPIPTEAIQRSEPKLRIIRSPGSGQAQPPD